MTTPKDRTRPKLAGENVAIGRYPALARPLETVKQAQAYAGFNAQKINRRRGGLTT